MPASAGLRVGYHFNAGRDGRRKYRGVLACEYGSPTSIALSVSRAAGVGRIRAAGQSECALHLAGIH